MFYLEDSILCVKITRALATKVDGIGFSIIQNLILGTVVAATEMVLVVIVCCLPSQRVNRFKYNIQL